MKVWLLLVWLALPLAAQTLGMLTRLSPNQAEFRMGPDLQRFELGADLHHKLSAHGLGSRWKLWSNGPALTSAIYDGTDRDLAAGLETLALFIRRINDSQWRPAYALLRPGLASLEQFTAFWAEHTLSPHQSDWCLAGVEAGRLEVLIYSTRGELEPNTLVSWQGTVFENRIILARQGTGWLVSEYR